MLKHRDTFLHQDRKVLYFSEIAKAISEKFSVDEEKVLKLIEKEDKDNFITNLKKEFKIEREDFLRFAIEYQEKATTKIEDDFFAENIEKGVPTDFLKLRDIFYTYKDWVRCNFPDLRYMSQSEFKDVARKKLGDIVKKEDSSDNFSHLGWYGYIEKSHHE